MVGRSDGDRKGLSKLTFLSELGNRRTQAAAGALSRRDVSQRVDREHSRATSELDLQQELHGLVARELAGFREESPRYYEFFRKLDMAAAAARPATSVILFVTGLHRWVRSLLLL